MTKGSLPELKLTGQWSDLWGTRWATQKDVEELQKLFSQAFKHDMSKSRWEWKYQDATAWGCAVERDGRIVGFYGGMPSLCVLKKEPLLAVQVGDVMVSPQERSAGRSGPLMRASASYIDNMPALYEGFAFAFGFPSERPMRLGVALGLYHPVEVINGLEWAALPRNFSLLNRVHLISKDDLPQYQAQINALWAQMQEDFFNYVVPVRDCARWLYRYANHPEISYQIVLISSRMTNKPLAAFVICDHSDHVELIDYVGGRSGVKLAINFARRLASGFGKPVVRGWFTNAIVSLFSHECSSVMRTGIEVPINLRGRTKEQAVLPAPLWLMAGDSDFR